MEVFSFGGSRDVDPGGLFIKSMSLTHKDLKGIATVVETVVRHELVPVKKDLTEVKENVGLLTTSMDGLTKIVRRHEDEWLVLRKQHEKMRDVMVKKGVATEEELAIA